PGSLPRAIVTQALALSSAARASATAWYHMCSMLAPTLAALLLVACCASAQAQGRPTRFWNLTRHTISEFYLAPVGTTNWGANRRACVLISHELIAIMISTGAAHPCAGAREDCNEADWCCRRACGRAAGCYRAVPGARCGHDVRACAQCRQGAAQLAAASWQ